MLAATLWMLAVLAGCKRFQPPAGVSPPPNAAQYSKLPPVTKPTPPVGTLAIRPLRSAAPAFAADDVRAFVMTHPLPRNVNRDTKITILRIDFLSNKDLTSLLHGENTGFPDDYPLCYVELKGEFAFAGPKGVVATFPRGVEIFDARTGNFLMSGGLPAAAAGVK